MSRSKSLGPQTAVLEPQAVLCGPAMALKDRQNHAGMDGSDIAVGMSEIDAYFCASQNPRAFPHDRLKGLQRARRMEHETQVPHILIPCICAFWRRHDIGETHNSVPRLFILVAPRAGGEKRDETAVKRLFGDDVFGDGPKVEKGPVWQGRRRGGRGDEAGCPRARARAGV